jgi:hypothetical protein
VRTIYLAVILGFPVLAVLNALYFGSELRRFADRTPRLETPLEMTKYRRLVGRQMYAALLQLLLLAIPPIVFFYGLIHKILTVPDILFVVVPSAILIVIAQLNRRHEARIRTLPTATEQFAEERDAIVRTWVRKPLPDW